LRWRAAPVDEVALGASELSAPETELPVAGSFSIGWARSRLGLGRIAAQWAFMASGFFYLAYTLSKDAVRSSLPLNLLFDIAVPLAFLAAGCAVTVLMLEYIHAFAYAERPYLTVSEQGLSVSTITRPIAWEHIGRVFVHRSRPGTFPVVWLTKDSRYYRRFWPFWRAGSISLHTLEPGKTVAMIRAHPSYRGEPDDA
jgi:hypothetical protein